MPTKRELAYLAVILLGGGTSTFSGWQLFEAKADLYCTNQANRMLGIYASFPAQIIDARPAPDGGFSLHVESDPPIDAVFSGECVNRIVEMRDVNG